MQLLHKGKVKEVYAFGEDKLLFHFTDQISVFDKIIPTLVPHKGATLARTAAYWFEEVAKAGIVDTHFLGLQDDDKMLVKRLAIIHDSSKITPGTTSFFIPLEVVCRHYVAGSFHDRLKSGSAKPEDYGLPAGKLPDYGTKLPAPLVEFTTKLEATDRLLDETEAFALSGLTQKEFADLKSSVIAIDALIAKHAEARGLIHVDGKKEFGMNAQRELMVVDTFGTLDEDRWWDRDAFRAGRIQELSKEMVRQHYRATGYHEKLYAARKSGAPEPAIPAMPAELTAAVSKLYTDSYTRLTGRAW